MAGLSGFSGLFQHLWPCDLCSLSLLFFAHCLAEAAGSCGGDFHSGSVCSEWNLTEQVAPSSCSDAHPALGKSQISQWHCRGGIRQHQEFIRMCHHTGKKPQNGSRIWYYITFLSSRCHAHKQTPVAIKQLLFSPKVHLPCRVFPFLGYLQVLRDMQLFIGIHMAQNLKSLLGTQVVRKGMWINLELLSLMVYSWFNFPWYAGFSALLN